MAWTSRFAEKLNDRGAPMLFRVELEGHGLGVSRRATLSGVPGFGGHPVVLAAGAPKISGTSVTPQSWAPSWGSATIDVAGPDFLDIAPDLRRGSVGTIYAGFLGWPDSWFQPVFRGVLKNWRGNARNAWTLEFWDLLAGYRTRQTTNTGGSVATFDPPQIPMFYSLRKAITTASSWSPGDTEIYLDDVSTCGRDSNGGAVGVVKITPSGSGSPFYLSFLNANAASNRLEGVVSGLYSTTAVAVPAGSEVQPVAWLHGHPVDIVRRLFTSGASGRSPTWGTYPTAWSFNHAIPESWLGLADMALWESFTLVDDTGTPGRYVWTIIQEEPVDDAIAWLQSYLSTAGMWLVQRQGDVVVRGCQDVDPGASRQPNGTRFAPGAVVLDEGELVSFDGWTAFHPSMTTEAGRSRILGGNAGFGARSWSWGSITGLPAVDVIERDMTSVIHSTYWSDLLDGDLHRVSKWDLAAPEVVQATFRAWPAGGLCAGDVVRLNLPRHRGRLPSTRRGYVNRPVTVLSSALDMGNRTAALELAVQPYLHEL